MEQEIMLDADELIGSDLDSTFDSEVIEYEIAKYHAKEDGLGSFFLSSQLHPSSDIDPVFRDRLSLLEFEQGLAAIK